MILALLLLLMALVFIVAGLLVDSKEYRSLYRLSHRPRWEDIARK
jgi:hypothetical protein